MFNLGKKEEVVMGIALSTYAAYSTNEFIRMSSSSGGVFSLLAKQILDKEGIVYGVAMSHDCKYAEFIRVDTHSDLAKLRGSKYLQARVGRTYRKVKLDLESELTVLFTGTGCQISGLKNFLGKEYSNLYCVDVICHGVPSPKLWKEYVEYNEKQQNKRLVSINFRCKDDSWIDFGIKRKDEGKKELYISKDKDPYMIMFLRDYCLRPSCYECLAKNNYRSDLTLADFWGIDKVAPELNDGKGTSLVMIRSEKGCKLFENIKKEIVFREVSYDDGVRDNKAEYSSADRPEERNYFFDDLNVNSFEDMIMRYGTPTPIPLKRKIKNKIMEIILKATERGGYKLSMDKYGMLFVFEDSEGRRIVNK